MNKLIRRSFLNALGTVAYIILVGTIMRNAEKIFGKVDDIFAPVIVLTLFVLSAAITGSLILGKPVLLFLEGNKSEAIKLFTYTLGWLAIALLLIVTISVIVH